MRSLRRWCKKLVSMATERNRWWNLGFLTSKRFIKCRHLCFIPPISHFIRTCNMRVFCCKRWLHSHHCFPLTRVAQRGALQMSLNLDRQGRKNVLKISHRGNYKKITPISCQIRTPQHVDVMVCTWESDLQMDEKTKMIYHDQIVDVIHIFLTVEVTTMIIVPPWTSDFDQCAINDANATRKLMYMWRRLYSLIYTWPLDFITQRLVNVR